MCPANSIRVAIRVTQIVNTYQCAISDAALTAVETVFADALSVDYLSRGDGQFVICETSTVWLFVTSGASL